MKGLFSILLLVFGLNLFLYGQERSNNSKTIIVEGIPDSVTTMGISEIILDTTRFTDSNKIIRKNDTANSVGWVSLSPPVISVTLNDVHTFNENTAIVIGNSGSIYRTTNRGNDWAVINSGVNSDLSSLYFLDDKHGWIVGKSGTVLKSDNGGITWINLDTELYNLLDVKFLDLNTGWTLTSSRIYKTTDGGITWIQKFQAQEVTYFFESITFSDPNTGIAVGSGKLFRTADGGETWNAIESGGATWMYDTNFIDSNHGWISGLRASRISITVGGGLFGGDVSITIDNPQYTLWETTDAGAAWTQRNISFSGSLTGVYFNNSSVGWAVGTNGAVLSTSDGGINWNIAKSPHNMNSVHFKDINNGWAVGTDGTILNTSNGGNSWLIQSGRGTANNLVTQHFFNSQIGWVAGANGKMLKTTDGGEFWFELNPKTSGLINSIFFVDDQKGFAVDDWSSSIRTTTNGGDTWNSFNSQSNDYPFESIYFVDPQNGWIVGKRGAILKTSTGSTSYTGWSKQNSNTKKNLNSVHFADQLNGWAVGDSAIIIHTNDGGSTWSAQSANLDDRWDILKSVHFTSQSTGFIVGNSKILKTIDGGANWVVWDIQAVTLNYVHFFNDQIGCIVGNNGTILRTTDGGNTWGLQTCETTMNLYSVRLVDNMNGYIIGWGGTILKTIDGGGTTIYAPAAPNLSSPNTDATDVPILLTLKWTAPEGAEKYNLQVSEYQDFSNLYLDEKDITETSYTLSKLKNDQKYYWRIRAYKDILPGQWSEIRNFTTEKLMWVNQGTSYYNLRDVYFTDNLYGWVVGDEGKILNTVDGGDTWVVQTCNDTKDLNSVYFTDRLNGWAAGEGNIYKTDNGGNTWTQRYQITSAGYIPRENYEFINNEVGYFIYISRIYKTTDGGFNWFQPSSKYFYGFSFIDEFVGWAIGQDGIYKTIDGGTNWSLLFKREVTFYEYINFIDVNNGWLSPGDGSLMRTTDGGVNWSVKYNNENYSIGQTFFINKETGWVSASDINYNDYLLKTIDGGNSWDEYNPSGIDLSSIFFIDSNNGWIVGAGGIWHTELGGVKTDIQDEEFDEKYLPNSFILSQNYPNPFNPTTTISYTLPEDGNVQLKIFDVLGREVTTLLDGFSSKGKHSVVWNGRNFSSGIYFYSIIYEGMTLNKKMLMIQ